MKERIGLEDSYSITLSRGGKVIDSRTNKFSVHKLFETLLKITQEASCKETA